MPFVGTEAFEDAAKIVALRGTSYAESSAASAAKQAFAELVHESSGYTEEHAASGRRGVEVFDRQITNAAQVIAACDSFLRGPFIPQLARYLAENDGTSVANPSDLGEVARATITAMLADSPVEYIEANAPTVGTPAYGKANQGNGTASIAVHSDATLRELMPDGELILECLSGSYTEQNAERWLLGFRPSTQITGRKSGMRFSPSPGFVTGQEYIDVISLIGAIRDDPRLQIPQFGASIHTGAIITVTTPNYDSSSVGTDADSIAPTMLVQKKSGTKSPLTKRNCTWAKDASRSGTVYVHVVKDGANYYVTVRSGSSANSPALTETKTVTTLTSGEQLFAVAATNPESRQNGGELVADVDTFCGINATWSNLATSNVIDIAFPLPWARNDKITCAATNGYTGLWARAVQEAWGLALPASGSPTITDP